MLELDEVKLYLRIDGDEEDALIKALIAVSVDLCEGILRYPLTDFDVVPELVQNAVLFSIASMYEKREGEGFKTTLDVIKSLLSPYRKESW